MNSISKQIDKKRPLLDKRVGECDIIQISLMGHCANVFPQFKRIYENYTHNSKELKGLEEKVFPILDEYCNIFYSESDYEKWTCGKYIGFSYYYIIKKFQLIMEVHWKRNAKPKEALELKIEKWKNHPNILKNYTRLNPKKLEILIQVFSKLYLIHNQLNEMVNLIKKTSFIVIKTNKVYFADFDNNDSEDDPDNELWVISELQNKKEDKIENKEYKNVIINKEEDDEEVPDNWDD
jgi:hypothetical protein